MFFDFSNDVVLPGQVSVKRAFE